jgi:polyferredoxin
MVTVFSRIASPTILLYLFVVITQIGFGIYYGLQVEPPPALRLIYALALLWIIGWWLRRDSRKQGVPWVYDMGFFLVVAWPFIIPYYLVKSRGAKGLFVILGFVGAYIGAVIIGIIISVLAITSG